MSDWTPILGFALSLVSALVCGGGVFYGIRFLRRHELIDTRPAEFVSDTLFGSVGSRYKLFYTAHSAKHGRGITRLLLAVHFACVPLTILGQALSVG